jgi:hypothetical protein
MRSGPERAGNEQVTVGDAKHSPYVRQRTESVADSVHLGGKDRARVSRVADAKHLRKAQVPVTLPCPLVQADDPPPVWPFFDGSELPDPASARRVRSLATPGAKRMPSPWRVE